jgi:hypothetical protein
MFVPELKREGLGKQLMTAVVEPVWRFNPYRRLRPAIASRWHSRTIFFDGLSPVWIQERWLKADHTDHAGPAAAGPS